MKLRRVALSRITLIRMPLNWWEYCSIILLLLCWISFWCMCFCWMSFCWVKFCWLSFWRKTLLYQLSFWQMSFCWVSLCRVLFCWLPIYWLLLFWKQASKCHFAESLSDGCLFAECRGAKQSGSSEDLFVKPCWSVIIRKIFLKELWPCPIMTLTPVAY